MSWWRLLDEASRNETDTLVLFPIIIRLCITAAYAGAAWKVFGS